MWLIHPSRTFSPIDRIAQHVREPVATTFYDFVPWLPEIFRFRSVNRMRYSISKRFNRRVRISLRRLRAFRKDASGQTVVLAAVGLGLIVAFLGLGVDVGHLRYVKRNLQTAADAAALAAAIEVQSCDGTEACTAMQTAAQDALSENGFSGSTVVTDCATTAVSGLKLMVNNPPCALGTADPNHGKGSYVEVQLSQSQPTYFAGLVGWNNVPIVARAEAARTGGCCCIFALDPSGANAITVDLLAVVTASCGIMDESSSRYAFTCNLLAGVAVSQINVVGGDESLLCGISPTPKTGVSVPVPADPLAYLPKPAVPACGTSTGSPYHGSASALNIYGTATLYPDYAYCGGINLLPGANVTFEPGTYVLTSSNNGANRSPGGLQIDLGTNVTGTGVTFYNYGPSGGITFGLASVTLGTVNLVAPTSGSYEGILFFQDPGNTSQATILGTSALNTSLQGAFYFPKAKVAYALSGPVAYNILDAYDIEFVLLTLGGDSLSSAFSNNYTSLADGSPVAGSGAVLVQ
jgi:Flp pilus assembly protein TadG